MELLSNAMQGLNAMAQSAKFTPNTEASIVNYFFENQLIIPWLRKITNQVLEHPVDLPQAWLLSMNIHRVTPFLHCKQAVSKTVSEK